jgi:hypothetical protein
MKLPLEIQMQIDLTAQAHKRELSDAFAKLRASLTPPQPAPDPMRQASLQSMLAAQQSPNPYLGSCLHGLMYQNQAPYSWFAGYPLW